MAISDIFGILNKLAGFFTPEEVQARARDKLESLKNEREKLLTEPCTPNNIRKLSNINDNIRRLQNYLSNH